MTTGGSVISSYLGNWDAKTEVMKFDGVENSLLKIRSESGKLFFFGCRFPPKSRNFGTLFSCVPCTCEMLRVASLLPGPRWA